MPFPGLRFDPRLSLKQFLEVQAAAQAYIDILQAPYIPQDIPLEIRKIYGVDHYPKGKTGSGYLYWLPVRPDDRRKFALNGEAERLCTPEGLELPWVQYPDGRYGAYDPETRKAYYILRVDAEGAADE